MKANHNPPHSRLALLARLSRNFRRLKSRMFPSPERRSAGQGLVEFALVLPFLLLLLLGIIEFSYIFAAYTSLFNAAREGVRYGVVQPKDKEGIVYSAKGKIFLVNPDNADIVVAYDSGPGTTVFTDTDQVEIGESRVVITVTYDLPAITPAIHPLWPTFHVGTQAARTVASLGEIETVLPGGGGGGGGGEGGGGEGGNGPLILDVAADPQMVHSGDAVLFTYTVTNTGDVDLTDVTIVDGFGNIIFVGDLAADTVAIETVTENLVATTTNEVAATGTDPEAGTVSASDSITVTVINPALDLTVEASSEVVLTGGSVTFIYTVQNTGDVDLTDVTVTDSLGASTGPVDLAVGGSVFWEVGYFLYETTTNNVIATGADPLGETVSDSDSATVTVLAFSPIIINDPLYDGSTVVAGTAQSGQTIYIRDLMDESFPAPASNSTIVLEDGSFEFAGLPPLVGGHVIVVEGYGDWDSTVVQGADLAPIVISVPLCHGSGLVGGTAEPDQVVTLVIEGAGYQDSTTVDDNGNYTFILPEGQPLQAGQSVVVNGYEQSSSAYVEPCTADPYITISPQCGAPSPPQLSIAVAGGNWISGNNYTIRFCWDSADQSCQEVGERFASSSSSFDSKVINVDVCEGTHTIRAELWYKIDHSKQARLEQWAEASFLSPCPAPNLVITDLRLLTTEPISTYQPLDFSVTVENVGTMPVNNLFWVDLDSSQPVLETAGIAWGAVSALGVGDSTTLIITLQSGFDTIGDYQIWALADSWAQVGELDEGDNDYGPTVVHVSEEGEPPPPPPSGTGSIEGETWVSLAGFPVPHGRADVWCVDEQGEEIASTTSDDDAQYELSNLPTGTYTVMAETWIDGVRYFGSVPNVVVADGETAVAIIIMYK